MTQLLPVFPLSLNRTARQNLSTRPVRNRRSAEFRIGSIWRPGEVSSASSFMRKSMSFALMDFSILDTFL